MAAAPGTSAPRTVGQIALSLAARIVPNPRALRGVSTEGPSVDLPMLGLLCLQSLLLNPYRRRSA